MTRNIPQSSKIKITFVFKYSSDNVWDSLVQRVSLSVLRREKRIIIEEGKKISLIRPQGAHLKYDFKTWQPLDNFPCQENMIRVILHSANINRYKVETRWASLAWRFDFVKSDRQIHRFVFTKCSQRTLKTKTNLKFCVRRGFAEQK